MATEVDHIVAVADGGSDDPFNLQATCTEDHRHITAVHARATQTGGQKNTP